MPLMTTEASLMVRILWLSAVSISSSLCLLLINENRSSDPVLTRWEKMIPFSISISITVTWAIWLGSQDSILVGVIFSAAGVIPMVTLWLSLMSRPIRNVVDVSTGLSLGEQLSEQIGPVDQIVADCSIIQDSEALNSETDFEEIDELPDDDSEWQRQPSITPDVTQWLTRSITVEGEIIEGGLRVNFDEGQRDATLHVSFCPPFRKVPEVTTEDLDAAQLEIRVAAIFPFGARLNVRRPLTASEGGHRSPAETYRIGFVARSLIARRAA